eukprot:365932-Chlamydomonas_euryale.AAC.6
MHAHSDVRALLGFRCRLLSFAGRVEQLCQVSKIMHAHHDVRALLGFCCCLLSFANRVEQLCQVPRIMHAHHDVRASHKLTANVQLQVGRRRGIDGLEQALGQQLLGKGGEAAACWAMQRGSIGVKQVTADVWNRLRGSSVLGQAARQQRVEAGSRAAVGSSRQRGRAG